MRRAVSVAARRACFSGWEEGTTRSLTETLSSLLATPPSVLRPPGYVLQTRCSTLGALCSSLYTRFERPNPVGFRFVGDLPSESDEFPGVPVLTFSEVPLLNGKPVEWLQAVLDVKAEFVGARVKA